MISQQALIPQWLAHRGDRVLDNIIFVAFGVGFLALLAQVAVPLSWTPVPVTGQTFGVALMSLLWGRKRGLAAVGVYLILGAAGLPIFAIGSSGFSLGPTAGYLIGMLGASYWMGLLADQGWTKTFFKSWLAVLSGSLITFSCGVIVLSAFVPFKDLLLAGVLPFLPGDFIKTLMASYIAYRVQKSVSHKV